MALRPIARLLADGYVRAARHAAFGSIATGVSAGMGSSRLNQVLHSVADAGRELLRRGTPATRSHRQSPHPLCEALLSTRGEASGTALARDVTDAYRAMTHAEKRAFFTMLAAQYGPAPDAIHAASDAYKAAPGFETLMELSAAIESPRQELFRRINMAPEGTATIVAMRRDLLQLLPDDSSLRAVDADLVHLLASWFNRGFLHLRQIQWESSAALLQKIMAYESVHAMAGWDELRRRLADDRRCFAFFHPALADEPLIFVEVALTRGMASAVQPLLADGGEAFDPREADTAIFYAINNCQAGLVGISFGNFLIKQVVVELAREMPNLKAFATLSPIPRLRSWLATLGHDAESTIPADEAEALTHISTPDWHQDREVAERVRKPLMRLCARYLLNAGTDGRPLDPVARFHLRNGARLERINWLGDLSHKGLSESAGLMVNYLYDLKTIERNHEGYVKTGRIAASAEIRRLIR